MRTAVYSLIFEGQVVYIGCTKTPHRRLKWHQAKRPQGGKIEMRVMSWHNNRWNALTREYDLIRKHSPPWNVIYSAELLARKKTEREAARRAKEWAEWQELAAKNKKIWDEASAAMIAAGLET